MYILKGRAFRCMDCDALTDNSHWCDACGSIAVYNEDRLLDRGLPKTDTKMDISVAAATA
jgi:hypothetical protein